MGYLADIYIIKKTRSKKTGLDFINHFLPEREESATVYEYPRFGKTVELVFNKAEELMTYLENNPISHHCIYWRSINKDNLNRHGMIFYTPDSYMIFGISRNHRDFNDKRNEEECFEELKRYFETEDGYITYECPPEDTYRKFMEVVKSYNKTK